MNILLLAILASFIYACNEDKNPSNTLQKWQALYPYRAVVSIDSRNVYVSGSMTHCVTQQQPAE